MSDEMEAVFVFGSNLAGRHGRGAAKYARVVHGAVYGKGVGHFGNSYALPTKDTNIKTLPLENIQKHVMDFLDYANDSPELVFQVTRVGCGLAGLTDDRIAPMFKGATENCQFDEAWRPYLGDNFTYWGHVA